MSKVLVLAAITMMSASAFAADSSVGQTNAKDCASGTNLVEKKQDEKGAPAVAPATQTNTNNAGAK